MRYTCHDAGGGGKTHRTCFLCIGPFSSFHMWKMILREEATCPRSHRMTLDKLGLHGRSLSVQAEALPLYVQPQWTFPTMCSSGHHSRTVFLNCFLFQTKSQFTLQFSFLWVSVCHLQAIYYPHTVSSTTYMIHDRKVMDTRFLGQSSSVPFDGSLRV